MKDPRDEYAEKLAAELAKRDAEVEAIKQEFTKASVPANAVTPEFIAEKLDELVPIALLRIKHIMEHSDSDGIQFNASKFILQTKLARLASNGGESDSFEKLLKELAKR